MVAIDRPPLLTGVLLDVGGTLWSERWTPDPPLLAERMRSTLPVEQDVHQLITSAASLAGLRLPTDDARAVRRAMCLPAAGRGDCFPGTPDLLHTIQRLGLRCAVVRASCTRSRKRRPRATDPLTPAPCDEFTRRPIIVAWV
jgi:hypothetical protein